MACAASSLILHQPLLHPPRTAAAASLHAHLARLRSYPHHHPPPPRPSLFAKIASRHHTYLTPNPANPPRPYLRRRRHPNVENPHHHPNWRNHLCHHPNTTRTAFSKRIPAMLCCSAC